VLLFGVLNSNEERSSGSQSSSSSGSSSIQSSKKDSFGSYAESVIVPAVSLLKSFFPSLLVICDVCLCAYTDHGHCCVFKEDEGERVIDLKTTVSRLASIAVAYAEAGADVLAPSDMMQGTIRGIKEGLRGSDRLGLWTRVAVMAYVKAASAFYGPFRDVAKSSPAFGDRRTYQLPPGGKGAWLDCVEKDVKDGADFILIKPAMPYLDIVSDAKRLYPNTLFSVYQVSGEYCMLYHAAQAGSLYLGNALQETWDCFRRAGAEVVITYFAEQFLDMFLQGEKGISM